MHADHWWENPDTLHSVASWAVDVDRLGDRRALLHFMEKPWNYNDLCDDYRTWQALEEAGLITPDGEYEFGTDDSVKVRDAAGDLFLGVGEGWGRPECSKCPSYATVAMPDGPLCLDHLIKHLSKETA